MKKTLLSLILFAAAFCLFAQNEKAYMFQPEGSLYTENADGELVWSASLFAGAELEVITKVVNGKTVRDEKDAKRTVNGKKSDCHVYHVLYNDKPYYVVSDRISIQDDFAVITKESAIYRSPDLADVMDSTLATGTFITYDADKIYYPLGTNIKNQAASFKKINYYDPVAFVVKTCYVKASNMETQRDDLKTLQVLAKLKTIKDDVVRKELLNNIKNLNNSKGVAYLVAIENKAYETEFVEETETTEVLVKKTEPALEVVEEVTPEPVPAKDPVPVPVTPAPEKVIEKVIDPK
jgi:hypothetical protein